MKNSRNWLVLLGLYLGVPAGMLALPVELRVRLGIPVLLVIAAGCGFAMSRQKRQSRDELRSGETMICQWRGVLLRFLIGGVVLAVVAKRCVPEWFLSLPMDHPRRWLAICVLYPLLSVCPQEMIYRVFFFDLASGMFPGLGKWWLVVVNAMLFGFAHVVFGNVWAPLMAMAGGVMFASNYASRRSFLCVVVEHAMWGDLIFTLGLGPVFAGGTVAHLLMR